MPAVAPLTHGDIEMAMRNAMAEMERLTLDFAEYCENKARAEAQYKAAFAKARVKARESGVYEMRKVTVDMAEDIAKIQTQEELLAFTVAEAKHDSCRQALMSVRSQLEVLRSLMASSREIGA